MSVSANGQGPREKSRTPKPKAIADAPAAPLSTPQTAVATPTPTAQDASTDPIADDSTKSSAPRYASFFLLQFFNDVCCFFFLFGRWHVFYQEESFS